MRRIACLHTIDSNVDVFEAALTKTGFRDVALSHAVRPDLLAGAERAGHLTPEIRAETAALLRGLCAEADAVLLTCSTLGPAVEEAGRDAPVPVMRVDAALAAEAVADGGRIAVLCAVETTLEPTRRLFEAAARGTGAEIAMHLVPGAWAALKAGDRDLYLATIADAVRDARRAGAARVALAQASMASAGERLAPEERPLDSPRSGLAAAVAAMGGV